MSRIITLYRCATCGYATPSDHRCCGGGTTEAIEYAPLPSIKTRQCVFDAVVNAEEWGDTRAKAAEVELGMLWGSA